MDMTAANFPNAENHLRVVPSLALQSTSHVLIILEDDENAVIDLDAYPVTSAQRSPRTTTIQTSIVLGDHGATIEYRVRPDSGSAAVERTVAPTGSNGGMRRRQDSDSRHLRVVSL